LEKKDKIQKSLSNDDNKKLQGKNVKYYSGVEKKKPEPPKPKSKFQEDGQTIRGSTKKNQENKSILNYVEDGEDDINKNAKIQLEIKESVKSLENLFDDLHALFHKTEFLGTKSIPSAPPKIFIGWQRTILLKL
jgi:hypothetical protein